MRIINAKIETMAGKCFEKGFIEFSNGKITAIGDMSDCPNDNAKALDAGFRYVMPGLIDAHTHLGMWEDSMGFEGDDGNEDTDPVTPHLRGIDGINPCDRAFREALDWGVTTIVTGPGSANVMSGQMVAMKTHGVCVDDMIIRAPLAIKMAFGENPKTTHHEKDAGPCTRMGIAALAREQLYRAKKYMEQLERARANEDYDEPEYDAKCESLIPLLRGEISAHIHAHRLDDIFTAARIAREFSFKYVLVHATQGHTQAKKLAELGVPVVAGPLLGARTKPELAGMDIAGPAIMSGAGIPVAICTDYPELPSRYLMLSVQMAVRDGMDERLALQSVTSVAAEICGLGDRIGKLAVGMDADIIMLDEPPMVSGKRPCAVFVDGNRVR